MANNFQHCWTLHAGSVYTPSWMLLHVIGSISCRTKFQIGQTFEPINPNIFVPWSQKHSTTTLNPFVQLFPYCWRPCTCITHGLQSFIGSILPMMHCRSQHRIWSCWICSYIAANTDTTTPLCMKLKVLDLLQGHNLTMLIKSLINTLTWLKSDAILSVVDRTVATFTTWRTISLYEFQVCY